MTKRMSDKEAEWYKQFQKQTPPMITLKLALLKLAIALLAGTTIMALL